MKVAGGVAGCAYQQLTGDSGSGAKLGLFQGSVFAVVPNVVYNTVLMHKAVPLNCTKGHCLVVRRIY